MIYYGPEDQQPDVVTRRILFNSPVITRFVRIELVEAMTPAALKVDLVGMTPDMLHLEDPVLDQEFIEECKHLV